MSRYLVLSEHQIEELTKRHGVDFPRVEPAEDEAIKRAASKLANGGYYILKVVKYFKRSTEVVEFEYK